MNFCIKKRKVTILPFQKITFAILLLVCMHVQAQVNYLRTFDATAPEQNATDLMSRWVSDVKTTTQYIDGLGRPIQTVIKQGSLQSSNNEFADIVIHTEYDQYGREQFKYLPFAANTTGGITNINNGSFKTNPLAQQQLFASVQYPGETNFYEKINFEPSPLNRVSERYAPGKSWGGSEVNSAALQRNVQTKYYINTAIDDVKILRVTNNSVMGNFGSYSIATSINNGVYEEGQLYKNITTDEHKKQVIEFKDKEDKLILKKVQLTAVADGGAGTDYLGWLCTYYIYDEQGNLRCVIQPEGVRQLVGSSWQLATTSPNAYTTLLSEQCFRYEYDGRQRMIKRNTPGAGDVSMVYDERDRLILTQDANMRTGIVKWMYTKYDELNRPIASGLWPSTLTYAQHAANAIGNLSYPTLSGEEELSSFFYDNYTWLANYNTGLSSTYDNVYDTYFQTASNNTWPYPQNNLQSQQLINFSTGKRTKILGTANAYLYNLVIYDEKGRTIQSQSTNITGGVDIVTTQYTWSGQPLIIVKKQQLVATNNGQSTITVNQMSYDDLGRPIKTEIKLSNTLVSGGTMAAYKTITENKYDKLGKLVEKRLGPTSSTTQLETEKFDYNVRGWLLGMNRAYAKDDNGAVDNYFGYDLGYDKIDNNIASGNGYFYYNNPQFNGNIEGTVWKSKGDRKIRRYEFSYDAANRLLTADFNQVSSGYFNRNDNVDFSLTNMSYDLNGNILTMSQNALKINASSIIDNLKYNYITGTNKLKNVTDISYSATNVGDFKTNTTHPQYGIKNSLNATSPQASFDAITDYIYDANGNINIDNNKGITNITYNYLNLPQVITVTGKGTITYTYDAGGIKIKKEVAENGQPIKTTLYLGGAVFENNVMQFIGHEEGRIRFKPTLLNASGSVTIPASFANDFAIKDHLGSTRALLTDEVKIDRYPTATLEGTVGTITSPVEKEKAYFDINTNYVVPTPTAVINGQNYLNDNGTNNPNTFGTVGATSQKMYKLNAASNKTGLGMVLKVMAGDKLNILAKSYYYINAPFSNSPFNANTLIGAFLGTGLAVGGAGNTALSHGATSGALISNTTGTYTPINTFTNNNPVNPNNNVKAGIAYILFDEQFNYAGGGFDPILNDPAQPTGGLKPHFLQDIAVPKNGYIYIYCSNESNTDVFFDNLEVVHQRSPLLEETHYNPWGSKLLGISSEAANITSNKYKFNGKELQSGEFIDGSGLDKYDYNSRFYDHQIGRWSVLDLKADLMRRYSPYSYCFNNPLKFTDPDGNIPNTIIDPTIFAKALIEAEKSLREISFPTSINGINFAVTTINSKWSQINNGGIRAKNGVSPSEAINEFSSNPSEFSMDCQMFSGALILTALKNTMGDQKFNEYMRLSSKGGNGVIDFQNKNITGLNIASAWTNGGDVSKGKLMDVEGKSMKAGDLVSKTSVGSIITLTSGFLNTKNVFYNENIVKVGKDQYIAQGLGSGPLSMNQVKDGLVQQGVMAGNVPDTKQGRNEASKQIQVSSVIQFNF